jgi:hypothetical protein
MAHLKFPAVLTVGASLALAPALQAAETQNSKNPSMMDHGTMKDGRMQGGDMMGQMSRMMEACNNMMQAMNDHQGSEGSNQPRANPPASPGK